MEARRRNERRWMEGTIDVRGKREWPDNGRAGVYMAGEGGSIEDGWESEWVNGIESCGEIFREGEGYRLCE